MWLKRRPVVERDPEATAARKRAEQQLARRRADLPRVEAMANEWRRIREANHFAAAINATFRGGN